MDKPGPVLKGDEYIINGTKAAWVSNGTIAYKNFATETAFKLASEAIQIFGWSGLSKEYPIEKMFRNAKTAMIEDGANESLALVGAANL